MTFEEMQKWSLRFLQIIGAAQCLKNKRLQSMLEDLVAAYEGQKYDPFAGYMFAAIVEEMEV